MMIVLAEYADEGLVIRSTEQEDKERVGQIEGFGDLDYMMPLYDHYMQNPHITVFMAELNRDTAVALCYIFLVDDGQTVVFGGKRTHQDYRGRGYLSKLMGPLERYVTETYPGRTWSYTSLADDFQKQYIPKLRDAGVLKKYFRRQRMLWDVSVGVARSYCSMPAIQQLCQEYDVGAVMSTAGSLPECFNAPLTQLFPDERVVVFWEPYRLVPSNLQYISETVTYILTSTEDKNVVAVSFVTQIITNKTTLRVDVETYVNDAFDVSRKEWYVKQHMLKSLVNEREDHSGKINIACTFYFPLTCDFVRLQTWINATFPNAVHRESGVFKPPDYQLCEYDGDKLIQQKASNT